MTTSALTDLSLLHARLSGRLLFILNGLSFFRSLSRALGFFFIEEPFAHSRRDARPLQSSRVLTKMALKILKSST